MIAPIVGNPALLVIDMQHDFVSSEGSCSHRRRARCRSDGGDDRGDASHSLPVIWTIEAHRPSGIDTGLERSDDCVFPEHTIEGTPGIEIVRTSRQELMTCWSRSGATTASSAPSSSCC